MNVKLAAAPTTIHDVEALIQAGLEELRSTPLSAASQAALAYLLPSGYKLFVQMEEDGRKKRHTAAASNWKPETGEIVIYFEPVSYTDAPMPATSSGTLPTPTDDNPHVSASTSSEEIRQCCEALDRAEKVGKQFIAFKWFRDTGLLFENFAWSKTADGRQRVLSAAVEAGAIISSKIFNPKNPDFPTTAVVLNRAGEQGLLLPRFRPVPIKGEAASDTLLRDRGIG